MKKTLCLLLALLFCLPLAACRQEKAAAVRVWTLNGTTGFGMAALICQNEDGKTDQPYEFTVEKDAVHVRDAILSGEADIAAVPTNLAATLYNATNGGVRVLALNTLGVLHVVTAENISSLNDLAGKTVYTPAQNPAFIANALLAEAEISATIDSLTYAAPDALRDALASGLIDTAVLPEPMVTIAIAAAAKEGRTLRAAVDLTAAWRDAFGEDSLVQGCVVVRTEFLEAHPEKVQKFLREYEASVRFAAEPENAENAAEMIARAGIFENAAVAAKALPRCNLAYIEGAAMQTALSAFLARMPLQSIGGKLPDNDFYFISD